VVGSGPRLLLNQDPIRIRIQTKVFLRTKKIFLINKNVIFFLNLYKEHLGSRRSHPPNRKLSKQEFYFFSIFGDKMVCMDPDSQSGSVSAKPFEAGSNPDPDLKLYFFLQRKIFRSNIYITIPNGTLYSGTVPRQRTQQTLRYNDTYNKYSYLLRVFEIVCL
jgi:hypothetical protein